MNEIVMDLDLVAIPQGDALTVFTAEGKIDPILARVREKIDAFLKTAPDVSTASGRDAIKSFAFKVTKSKTALEAVGKDLAAEAKKIPGKIDTTRRHIEKTLDAWRDEVRQPVTDWETAEESRVAAIKGRLATFQREIDDREDRTAQYLRDTVTDIRNIVICEQFFGEYVQAGHELQQSAVATLVDRITVADKREAEAAELAQLRKEAIRRQAEETARQAAEDAVKAEREKAEAAARAEREAAEKRERDLKEAAERSEREKIEAQERAARAEQEAKTKAEADLKAQQAHEAAETAKREENKRHRAAVNRKAMAAFVAGGLDEEASKRAVELIALRQIPGIVINY